MSEREQVWHERIEWQPWSRLMVAECCEGAGVSVASFYRRKKLLTEPQNPRRPQSTPRTEVQALNAAHTNGFPGRLQNFRNRFRNEAGLSWNRQRFRFTRREARSEHSRFPIKRCCPVRPYRKYRCGTSRLANGFLRPQHMRFVSPLRSCLP